MSEFTHHVFVCGNQRAAGHPRGCCDPAGTDQLRAAFKAEIKSRGLSPLVRANSAGCLDQCEHGPCVVIYPQGIFYGRVTVADVPRIVEESIVQGKVIDELRVSPECLNNPNCPHVVERQEAMSRQQEKSSEG